MSVCHLAVQINSNKRTFREAEQSGREKDFNRGQKMQNTKQPTIAKNRTCQRHLNTRQEEIAKRAFQIFLAEGCPTGRALDNWCEAEFEYELEKYQRPPMPCGCGHNNDNNSHP